VEVEVQAASAASRKTALNLIGRFMLIWLPFAKRPDKIDTSNRPPLSTDVHHSCHRQESPDAHQASDNASMELAMRQQRFGGERPN
jgi:hypothetical protein